MQMHAPIDKTLAYFHERCSFVPNNCVHLFCAITPMKIHRSCEALCFLGSLPSKEDLSGNPSPSIVRSQRNNDLHPSDRDEIELEAARDGKAVLSQPSQTKLPSPPEPGSLD